MLPHPSVERPHLFDPNLKEPWGRCMGKLRSCRQAISSAADVERSPQRHIIPSNLHKSPAYQRLSSMAQHLSHRCDLVRNLGNILSLSLSFSLSLPLSFSRTVSLSLSLDLSVGLNMEGTSHTAFIVDAVSEGLCKKWMQFAHAKNCSVHFE